MSSADSLRTPGSLIAPSLLSNSTRGDVGDDLTIRPGHLLGVHNLAFSLLLLRLSPSPADADIPAELPGWETGLELDFFVGHSQSLLSCRQDVINCVVP